MPSPGSVTKGVTMREVMTDDALNYPASRPPVDNVCVKDTWADEARGERAEGYSTAGRDRIPPGPP